MYGLLFIHNENFIPYRIGYVTPMVTGSHNFHSDQCTTKWVWQGVASQIRIRKRDPVDVGISPVGNWVAQPDTINLCRLQWRTNINTVVHRARVA